jgi:hypothetical protein
VKVKWFDCRTSILLPGSSAMRYISPDFFPCDADLWERFLGEARIVAQPRWPDTSAVIFTAHELDSAGLVWPDRQGGPDLASQQVFGPLSFLKSEITRPAVERGAEAELLTFWTVNDRVPAPISIFVHIVAEDGKPLAQWDGFDFGEAQLEPGDRLIERHRFLIPASVEPGDYRVVVGVYNPATNKRFVLPTGQDHADIGTINVR